jgi:signal transduction histidine kinase
MTALAARITPAWLRRPRPTARLRLTLFYSALFVLSGACLLAIPYLLVRNESTGTIKVTTSRAGDSYTYVGPDGRVYGGTLALAPASGTRRTGFSSGQSRAVVEQLRALAVSQHASELHQLLLYSAIALAVMAVISVLLGWLVAGRVLRPVRVINATARRISATNLHQRLALGGPDDEFNELGITLNDLLERLDASFESQRRFVANASHELRTPLTVERTLLQVALTDPDMTLDTLRGVCEKLLTSGADQERLIDALLTLASSERGLEEPEPFDLAETVHHVVAQGALDRENKGLRAETTTAPAPTTGDPRLVQRLVSNLLDNAIRHNVPHGHLFVATGMRAGRPFVSVTNTGPVIPQTEISRLLEPFQQLGHQRTGHRNGHGLGLAIVVAIAAAHHADLSVRPRPEGGLAVEVTFSPQPSPHAALRTTAVAESGSPPAVRGSGPIVSLAHAPGGARNQSST